MGKQLPKSSLEYVLLALVPYTEPNLKLVFLPSRFFDDLEKISRAKRRTLQDAYYRAQREGLVNNDGKSSPSLTGKGQRRVAKFNARHLGKEARLMVIFDIPEREAWKRRRLRALLRELKFQQIQKSVWASEYDYRKELQLEVTDTGLANFVQIYEAVRI
jgi:CRISPR-associated endonuclease Cas2